MGLEVGSSEAVDPSAIASLLRRERLCYSRVRALLEVP